jgi:hypothetical protein
MTPRAVQGPDSVPHTEFRSSKAAANALEATPMMR